MSVGRLIARLVSTFDSVEYLVDEKDRRCALDLQIEEEEEDVVDPVEPSLAYVLLLNSISNLNGYLPDRTEPIEDTSSSCRT